MALLFPTSLCVPQALQHTNVSLTWDADDEGRKRALMRKMTADDIKEDDFAVSQGRCVPSHPQPGMFSTGA